MQNVLVIGKRFVPIGHVAYVEAFDPEANPRFQPTQEFRSRVVLVNRDSILALDTLETIAKEHGFRMLTEDRLATNPAVYFGVETYTPAEGFTPTKPFVTRLRWRDLDGNDQSKLLITAPETALATVSQDAEAGAAKAPAAKPERASRRKSRTTAKVPVTQP